MVPFNAKRDDLQALIEAWPALDVATKVAITKLVMDGKKIEC